MNLHHTNTHRPDDDAYWTPGDMTVALINAERQALAGRRIWECAAGAGWMALPLSMAGYDVVATTLIDYGVPGITPGIDMLTAPVPAGCDWIVTNPPYGKRATLANSLIERVAGLIDGGQLTGAALLLPSSYLHGRWRSAYLRRYLRRSWMFAGRYTLYPAGWRGATNSTTTINYAWFVLGRPGRPAQMGWL